MARALRVLGLLLLISLAMPARVVWSQPISPALGLRVAGGKLVSTRTGAPVQLRGVNISGLEFVAIGAPTWAHHNPWGAQTGDETPNWRAIRAWHANAIRLPLNQASWLGYSCIDRHGKTVNSDPWGNYRAAVIKAVAEANASGLYVILDLHWSAPGTLCPLSQDQMADEDHSIAFWTSLAATFKDNPAVLFDLFNEPYGAHNGSASDWRLLRDGGSMQTFSADSGRYTLNLQWQAAGMQTLLGAVRRTGARNVVLVAGLGGASDISNWLAYKPSDPLNQLALSWHAYSGINSRDAATAAAVLAAGIPVIISETGDKSANGTADAPVLTQVTRWADQTGASVLAWTWDRWNDSAGNPGKEK